jgi:hypothetical protein
MSTSVLDLRTIMGKNEKHENCWCKILGGFGPYQWSPLFALAFSPFVSTSPISSSIPFQGRHPASDAVVHLANPQTFLWTPVG